MHHTFAGNLETRDFGFDGFQRLLVIGDRRCGFQRIVALTPSDDMRRAGSEMLAGFPVNALSLMFIMTMPMSFQIGETARVNINNAGDASDSLRF